MKRKFNIRLHDRLEEVDGNEWKNPYGVRIFTTKYIDEVSGRPYYVATEYYSGARVLSDDHLNKLRERLDCLFRDNATFIDKFNAQVNSNTNKWGMANQ